MAKKKLLKKLKIDWKFVALVLGIILVGMSVFVLNQKATYKSNAQWTGGTGGIDCNKLVRDCMKDCNSRRVTFVDHDQDPSTPKANTRGLCKSNCSNLLTICK